MKVCFLHFRMAERAREIDKWQSTMKTMEQMRREEKERLEKMIKGEYEKNEGEDEKKKKEECIGEN